MDVEPYTIVGMAMVNTDGFYSHEPAATELCIEICGMLGIQLPWDGGTDPFGTWSDPTPVMWDGVEIVHAEPLDPSLTCEQCVNA